MFKQTDYQEFDLTSEEVSERKNQLVEELDRKDQLNADLGSLKSRQQANIKESEDTIVKLRNAIKGRKEMILCEIVYNDPKNGKKTLIREDNKKKVVMDMNESEIETHSQIDADFD